jgi:ribosomal protein L33
MCKNPSIITQAGMGSLFTDYILKYIEQGYKLHPFTMHGTQGEIARVDLVHPHDKKHIIRIWMIDDLDSEEKMKLSTRRIVVKEYEIKSPYDAFEILWLSQGTELESQDFYEIAKDRSYTTHKSVALKIDKLRLKRFREKLNVDRLRREKTIDIDKLPDSLKESIQNRIRSERGCKKASLHCVKSIRFIPRSSGHPFRVKEPCLYVSWTFKDHTGVITYK